MNTKGLKSVHVIPYCIDDKKCWVIEVRYKSGKRKILSNLEIENLIK